MFNVIKKIFLIVILFFAVASIPNIFADNPAQPIDKIVAVVNDEIITQSELDNMVMQMKQQMTQSNIPMPDDQKLRANILDQMINQKLQLQIAKRNNIVVTNDQVAKAIAAIAKQNNITVEQLKEKLAEQNINFIDFQNNIKKQITLQQVEQQAVGANINVTKADINNFLQQYKKQQATMIVYHLADILITLPDSPTPQQITDAKNQALTLQQKLNQGGDISKLTKQSNIQYSDLGWRPLQALPQLFVAPVSQLKVGQVSDPVLAPNGYHLLKLLEIHSAGATAATPSQAQLQQMVYRQKIQKAMQPWIQKLRSTSYIKIIAP